MGDELAMKQFRTGVIGCGGISGAHIPALMAMENVRLTAVADIRPERAQAVAERTGARVEASWQTLIAAPDIDVVHILTPHYLHAQMAIAALRAGKHVLTEKPMASELADAKAMIAESEKPGSPTLAVIFQNRYNPATVELKRIADSGEAGRLLGARANICWHREAPYYTESGWRGAWSTEGGGVLINQSIHTLDLLSYIGGPIARVKGSISTDRLAGVIEVEDDVHAAFDFVSGARGVLQATTGYVTDAPVLLECVFERGVYQLLADKLFRLADGVPELLLGGQAPTVADKAYWGSGHPAQIRDFYAHLERGEHFPIDGRSAYPALELLKRIYESSETGEWIALQGC